MNTLFLETQPIITTSGEEQAFKRFIKWARTCPQLIGFIRLLITDIISDEFEFLPLEGDKASGRNRIKKAQEFWKANNMGDMIEQTAADWLLLGIGYNWVGKLDEKEMREFTKKAVGSFYNGRFEGKELEEKASQIWELNKKGTESVLAQKIRHIPASTVKIVTDKFEPIKFVQRAGTDTQFFDTDEVIVIRLMPLDGRVYPYPPMESIISQVYLLWLITQNQISFFENGGHPDKVFVLPKEIAGSKNHRYLIETLKKYKRVQNKHGNLVFTGDLSIEDLQKVESQMENKDLSLYLIGVLAMMYGIPVSRIPFLIGKASSSGDAGGLADSGYWRQISVLQSKLEQAYNNGLWERFFGVRMKFKRGYKQDEIRETQNMMNKNTIAEQRLRLGLMTPEGAGDFLGIAPEEIAAAQKLKEVEEERQSNMLLQNSEKNQATMFEQDKQSVNARRKQKQDENRSMATPAT